MDFKKINWAYVLIMGAVLIAVVASVTFFTHTEVVVVTKEDGTVVTNNVTRLGMGDAPKPAKA